MVEEAKLSRNLTRNSEFAENMNGKSLPNSDWSELLYTSNNDKAHVQQFSLLLLLSVQNYLSEIFV